MFILLKAPRLFQTLLDIGRGNMSVESQPTLTVDDTNQGSKPNLKLPKMLPIGQVVVFDAVCVIDTAASATSKYINTTTKEIKVDAKKSSQVNTNIEVKKVIYMIGTKVTKIDDCKIGGVEMDVIGIKLSILHKEYNGFTNGKH